MWLEFACSAKQHVKRTNSESAHVHNLDNIEDCFVRQGVVSPKVLSSKPSYSTYWNLLETAYILRRALTREFKQPTTTAAKSASSKIFRHNPCVFLSVYEKIDNNSWNIDDVLQTTWKLSNWGLTREQDGTNVSFISHIHVRFLSSVISFIVLPTLPSSSSAVLLKSFLISQRLRPEEWTNDIFAQRSTH